MAEHGTDTVRVLLLARAGEARQRLETALEQAGAQLLRAVDPGEGDPGEAVALRPGAVLVALEPAIEDALERYDALLSDPGVLVMFDEAEVAARRDGWDAARWVRHLAAKLNGHQDVLPPGAESDAAVHPAPGPLPGFDFDPSSLDIGALADAAHDLAAEVPRAFEPALDADGVPPSAVGFDGLMAAEDMDWSSSGAYEGTLDNDPELAALLAISDAMQDDADADVEDSGATARDQGWTLSLADDQDDPDTGSGTGAVPEIAAETGAGPGVDAASDASTDAAAEAAPDPLSLGDGLSLADDEAPIVATAPTADAVDFDAFAARLDGLSLADPDSYGHGVLRGAVMVEAGLGGPDAVRQLLGGLGEEFARAVLVRLQLDGGRYDRLVQQMQRATSLPVALAEAGASADAGTVYFLPPGIVAVEDRARLVFAETVAEAGAEDGYGSLTATDSALVFLSGADAARVDRAMVLAAAGALVLAQAPDSCYDATAVGALIARGAVAAEPGDLAQALLDHWP